MARRRSETLTDAELRVMDVLWDRSEATVADAVSALKVRGELAYNTVLTTLRILEKKGYVTHRQEGRAFVYIPAVDRKQAQRHAIRHLVSRLFDGSPEMLVLNVVKDENLDLTEIDRLRRMVDGSES